MGWLAGWDAASMILGPGGVLSRPALGPMLAAEGENLSFPVACHPRRLLVTHTHGLRQALGASFHQSSAQIPNNPSVYWYAIFVTVRASNGAPPPLPPREVALCPAMPAVVI